MSSPIRGEMFRCAFAHESTYGTDPGTAAYTRVFGAYQTASLPDPEFDFLPFYALGATSKRNWYVTYRGRAQLSGGFGEVWLLNGYPLYLALGSVATTGTDSGTGGSTVDGNHNAGVTTVAVVSSTGYTTGDVVQIGTGATAECLVISSVDSNNLLLTTATGFYHATGETCNEVAAPYTHTITESVTLQSISLHVTYLDADGNVELMRRFLGGKVGRATLSGSEGDVLKISLDNMNFLDYTHNQSDETTFDKYDATIDDITNYLTYPCTQPYLFSYGSLTLDGTEFARLKDFRLSIDNSLEPKYYITDESPVQLPYEYREGKRRYELDCSIDIEDASLYKELLKQGHYSSVYKGFQTTLTFTRATGDTITITTPSTSPACGGNAMGCLIQSAPHNIVNESLVSVPLKILCRNVGVVIVDSIPVYPGQKTIY